MISPSKSQLSTIQRGQSNHTNQILLFDNALLLCISADPTIEIAELRALHLTQELLVMGNDDELEILLLPSSLDDLVQ
jgi:hypothetical protein